MPDPEIVSPQGLDHALRFTRGAGGEVDAHWRPGVQAWRSEFRFRLERRDLIDPLLRDLVDSIGPVGYPRRGA